LVALRVFLGSLSARIALGIVVGAVFVALAVRQVSIDELRGVIALIDWRWVPVAMALYACALSCRIVRWWTILITTASMRLGQTANALLIGYAVNVVLPARLGELFRADFCRREYGVPRTVAFGTILVERLADGIIVISALFVGVLGLRALGSTENALTFVLVAGTVLFGCAALGLYVLSSEAMLRLFVKAPRFSGRLQAFHSAIRLVRSARVFLVLLQSVVVWCFDGAALWAILLACGVSLDIVGVCLVVGVVSLSTLLPSPPGFVGPMQFAFVLPATIYSYSAAQGIVAASANQLFLLLPMAIFGTGLLSFRYMARWRLLRRERLSRRTPEPRA
jgi:uncharacterized protein (TIRG00374 family)